MAFAAMPKLLRLLIRVCLQDYREVTVRLVLLRERTLSSENSLDRIPWEFPQNNRRSLEVSFAIHRRKSFFGARCDFTKGFDEGRFVG